MVRGARGLRGARLWPLPAGAAACDQRSAVSRRSGRPAFFTAVFSTFTPAVKDSWVNSLQMAQLALGRPARPHGRQHVMLRSPPPENGFKWGVGPGTGQSGFTSCFRVRAGEPSLPS